MQLVIFDCDGTLVDSQHIIIAAMEAAFAVAGFAAPAPNLIRGIIGLSLEGAVTRLLQPGDHGRARVIAEDYKAAFRELRQQGDISDPLYPGVHEAIVSLAARDDVALAIATGKSRRGVDAILEREGLQRCFASIQTADDHPSKPDPSMIIQAMIETAAEPETTMMIGDTTFDIEMAANAGVAGIGVAWGYHDPAELTAAGASEVIARSLDLGIRVDRLLRLRSDTNLKSAVTT